MTLREKLLDKLLKQKEKEDVDCQKWTNEALKYAEKVQKVFGAFYYDGMLCTVKHKEVRADILSYNSYIGEFGDSITITDQQEFNKFKEILNKTFDINFKLNKRQCFEMFKNYGEHEVLKDRNANLYTLKYDRYNEMRAIEEEDGDIWFGETHGSWGCSCSGSFKYEDDMRDVVTSVLNLIEYKNKYNQN